MKRFVPILFSVVTMVSVSAQQRSITEILSIAQQHYSTEKPEGITRAANAIELIPSSRFIPVENQKESFYLCNTQNDGFVLVSADEQMPEILGYSAKGIDPSKGLPPGLLHVMKGFAGVTADAPIWKAPLSVQSEVSPLLTTSWDQGTPYNNMCPRDGASRSMVGCIATSAAQVMKYYEWPKTTPSGKIDYTTSSKKIKVSIDLSDYKFAWDLMLDKYQEGSYSNAQGSAVAKLMYAVGAVSKMDYSSIESGTTFVLSTQGMNEYFGYDNDMYLLLGDLVQADRWNQLIVDELDHSQPVLMSGSSIGEQSGHAFVLDGYRTQGSDIYYHVNWGWSGVADGYYLVNKMVPTDGGTGMGSGSFNDGQLIVLNCKPDDGITTPVYGQIRKLELSKNQFEEGEVISLNMSIKDVFCMLTKDFSGSAFVELLDPSGTSIDTFELGDIFIPSGEGLTGDVDDFVYPSLPEGLYTFRMYLKNMNGKRVDLLTNEDWPVLRIGNVESIDAICPFEKNKETVFDITGAEKKNASNITLPAGFYIIDGRKVIVK